MTGTRLWVAVLFLLPALVLLGALVVYPIGYSVWRSLFDADGSGFVGLDNYAEIFSDDATLLAVRNTAIWVAVAPALVTALGLIFAVLTERVRWGTAFKLIVFMPMAISMLAAGIIFRLVYEQDPDQGVANAVVTSVHDVFVDESVYPKARPNAQVSDLKASGGGSFTTGETVRAGTPALLPLVGIAPNSLPGDTEDAKAAPGGEGVTGTVWLDFRLGGGGEKGAVDPGEKALKGVEVEAVKDGKVVATATSGADGTFSLPESADGARLRLPGSNFAAPYNGIDWLGPTLVTPAVIGSYVWMWAGFAMVLIAAGLAGVDRNLLEAARVDGANEWQVFRKVTVPLLAPVLVVVLVTLMINVMKVFDLVYIIAPQPTQDEANVLALQLYLVSYGGGGDFGLGSAIGVVLLLLVLPVMWVNIRRLRKERQR
ncbi:carbohydrate ABC transporter permease [Streptomyces caniscabiei]|uniref:carbohydrate ABC transporter permease n=1 Tax=Streptomyces caniscabiei TaxID=2746961 RepID=UPI0015A6C968|nr:sugar ABC transporter permease [Streptomyces caniscabiei]MBE4740225.1 sugar ABC transporter permease [Streptomyces caniscabiei]MBE4759115.1 sugar ABC transporter permease [Streptomyces caniscabiei]MBE4772985.1 sugar ABC transporter permease [Streptomyces caniscabiei]MBE4788127.1 sugar ABC transporter permease [Streptomyces caniscabiei]MBE4797349.1 sugar ABC transporter permease [Streptomyces caniscabiei]